MHLFLCLWLFGPASTLASSWLGLGKMNLNSFWQFKFFLAKECVDCHFTEKNNIFPWDCYSYLWASVSIWDVYSYLGPRGRGRFAPYSFFLPIPELPNACSGMDFCKNTNTNKHNNTLIISKYQFSLELIALQGWQLLKNNYN